MMILDDDDELFTEYDNPCPLGLPYVDENDGNVAFCSSVNPLCPFNYWCHIGDRRQTTVCCPSCKLLKFYTNSERNH